MGWSTELFCNISFNRKTYNSLYEVEDEIDQIERVIQMYKDRINAYAVMTEPDKVIKFDDERYDNLLLQINDEVKYMLDEMEGYYQELFGLRYLKENWSNCHNEEGLAIAAPENIHWDTAYLDGDFVRTTKNPQLPSLSD